MSADFKSHVLRRDEKGLFGVPFKRLLLAGVAAGMAYTLVNLSLPTGAVPAALLTALLAVLLTAPRGGLPLWQRLFYRLRGALLLVAAKYPRSPIGQLTDMLELPVDQFHLDGDRLFAPPTHSADLDLREWVTFAHAHETDGLVFVDAPLQEGHYDRR